MNAWHSIKRSSREENILEIDGWFNDWCFPRPELGHHTRHSEETSVNISFICNYPITCKINMNKQQLGLSLHIHLPNHTYIDQWLRCYRYERKILDHQQPHIYTDIVYWSYQYQYKIYCYQCKEKQFITLALEQSYICPSYGQNGSLILPPTMHTHIYERHSRSFGTTSFTILLVPLQIQKYI